MDELSRRAFLHWAGRGTIAFSLSGCARFPLASSAVDTSLVPIGGDPGPMSEAGYTGEHPHESHRLLWDKAAALSQIRREEIPVEKASVVIIGGGMSGLLSAYLLKQTRPLVLEQAARFGGNSRAETWRGNRYSVGAAYFTDPDPDSSLRKLFFDDLGVQDFCTARNGDSYVWKGKRTEGFWEGAHEKPIARKPYQTLDGYFKRLLADKAPDRFPELPYDGEEMKKYAKSLDRNSLRSHLAKLVGGTLPRALEEAIENYSWSAFAASSQEISAAHGLNFLAAEFSTIQVPDGGNAAIAQRVFERLEKALPFGSLRAQSLVLDVRMSSEGVETLYYEKGKPKRVLSKALIFACPKFVAAKLWEEMEAPRRKAIEAISYRAYLVGNVLYEGEVPANFYDLYLLNGHGTGKSVRENAEHQRATDVVNAGFAAKRKTSGTVFTLYQSFPFAEGRGEVLPDASFERWKTVFHDQFLGEIAPVLGLDPKRISGLRLHRWGHPVPVAKKGALIADIPETISKPHANRIFFVEQDNWLLPALETCALEALAWTPHVRKSL